MMTGIVEKYRKFRDYTGFDDFAVREFFKYLYGSCACKGMWKYRRAIRDVYGDFFKTIKTRPYSYFALNFKLKNIKYRSVRKIAFEYLDLLQSKHATGDAIIALEI